MSQLFSQIELREAFNKKFPCHNEHNPFDELRRQSNFNYFMAGANFAGLKANEIVVKKLITDEDRQNLLCSALEGGSNYWYFIHDEALRIIDSIVPPDHNTPFVDRVFFAIKYGAVIPIHECDDMQKIGEISLEKIYKAEALMLEKYPFHFCNIINDNDDAETADVWFQVAVMGELVYG